MIYISMNEGKVIGHLVEHRSHVVAHFLEGKIVLL